MTADAPFRPLRLGPEGATIEHRADGSMLVRPIHALGPYPDTMTQRLVHCAAHAPRRTFLARREASGAWWRVSYGDTLDTVRSIGQALLDRGLSAERPLVILSGNGIEHALLALAALYVGVPYAPVATAYSLVARDFHLLQHILRIMRPGLVFADHGARYQRAIKAVLPRGAELVVVDEPPPGTPATTFDRLTATPATDAVDAAYARVTGDSIAKILFTSGSTSLPKGVINTHRMLSANQQQIQSTFAFLADAPPVLCDWLPWNHTFGGNHNLGIALYNGGTYYIDDGKPTPEAFETTVRNLREVRPTVYFNVPKGFELLVPRLQGNAELRRAFFSRLDMLFYAGAGLSQWVWDALDELAVQTCGYRVPIFTGLGATETAPSAMFAGARDRRAGVVGLPVPGVELKLAPVNGKLEARVRGPNVMPGYWRDEVLTRAAYDDDGFYRFGDAVRFVDPNDVNRGFLFDGRLGEDFKLATGTWVSVGPLRAAFLQHMAPYAQDVVVAGHDRDDIRVLIFPDRTACRDVTSDELRVRLQRLLNEFARAATGSSNRIVAAMVLEDPPSLDAREITDKGSINQQAVLRARADLVEELYRELPSSRVLHIREE
jgi:feruloyl-CoA synthase